MGSALAGVVWWHAATTRSPRLPHTRAAPQNAIKFTAGGAGGDGASSAARQLSSVGGEPISAGRVTLSAAFLPEDRLLEITVQDSGRGLSEEGLARLFKPCAASARPAGCCCPSARSEEGSGGGTGQEDVLSAQQPLTDLDHRCLLHWPTGPASP